jgi:hypothetical protein
VNNILRAIEEGRELSGFDKYAADVIKDAVDLVNKLLKIQTLERQLRSRAKLTLSTLMVICTS